MNKETLKALAGSVVVLTVLILMAVYAPAAGGDTAASSESARTEVVSLALKYMGLEGKTDLKPTVEMMTVSPDTDPFRSDKYNGQRVWHVRIDSLALQPRGGVSDGETPKARPFDIYLDSASERLLRIVSRDSSYSDSTIEKPALVDAELYWKRQRGEADEPPAEVPTISFVEAVRLAKCANAPEIVGLCRIIGSPGEPNPRPGWLIHCYGLPRQMVVNPDRYIEGPRGTHTRIVISTIPGDFISQDWPAPLTPPTKGK